MSIGSGLGVELRASASLESSGWLGEHSAGYLLEVEGDVGTIPRSVSCERIGTVQGHATLSIEGGMQASIDEMTRAWRGTLDW
jgi:hypothetical protein